MQQAYRVLRIVSAAQAIRIVLMSDPDELMLKELCMACSTLNSEGSGIKAVVLDFKASAEAATTDQKIVAPVVIDQASTAVRDVEAPVLVVVRGTLSAAANALVPAADLTLLADDALINIADTHRRTVAAPYTGEQALRLGLVNWSVSASRVDAEMERILDMLRDKSAVTLRQAKASVRLAAVYLEHSPAEEIPVHLEALKQVTEFYLTHVMQTTDAAEGLRAFLEKRKPQWSNR
jgi:hypothetical protein